jgi:Na+/proline symporter
VAAMSLGRDAPRWARALYNWTTSLLWLVGLAVAIFVVCKAADWISEVVSRWPQEAQFAGWIFLALAFFYAICYWIELVKEEDGYSVEDRR